MIAIVCGSTASFWRAVWVPRRALAEHARWVHGQDTTLSGDRSRTKFTASYPTSYVHHWWDHHSSTSSAASAPESLSAVSSASGPGVLISWRQNSLSAFQGARVAGGIVAMRVTWKPNLRSSLKCLTVLCLVHWLFFPHSSFHRDSICNISLVLQLCWLYVEVLEVAHSRRVIDQVQPPLLRSHNATPSKFDSALV